MVQLRISITPTDFYHKEYTYTENHLLKKNTKDTNFLKRLFICPGKRTFRTTFPVTGVLDAFLITNFTGNYRTWMLMNAPYHHFHSWNMKMGRCIK